MQKFNRNLFQILNFRLDAEQSLRMNSRKANELRFKMEGHIFFSMLGPAIIFSMLVFSQIGTMLINRSEVDSRSKLNKMSNQKPFLLLLYLVDKSLPNYYFVFPIMKTPIPYLH